MRPVVPSIAGERRLMERTLSEELPESAEITLEAVDPGLFDDGGHGSDHAHEHGSGHGHSHSHDDAHGGHG